MFIKILKSKLHRAVVTQTRLHYPGSIEIDQALMDAAGIRPYESVLVVDLDNGNRFETYAVPGEAGGGKIVVLGAAAKLADTGDLIIIMAFAYCTPEEADALAPKVVTLDGANKIVRHG
jgi:aspartate 1-decarboxylase